LKNFPYYEVRDLSNIKQLVNDSCKIYADRTAYLVKKQGIEDYQEIKYSQVKEDVDAIGTALINLSAGTLSSAVSIPCFT